MGGVVQEAQNITSGLFSAFHAIQDGQKATANFRSWTLSWTLQELEAIERLIMRISGIIKENMFHSCWLTALANGN